MNLYVEVEKPEVDVLWIPSQYAHKFLGELQSLPQLNLNNVTVAETVTIPGVIARVRLPQFFIVYIDHWLICLTFLIATVVTSWRGTTNERQTVESDPESVTEDE